MTFYGPTFPNETHYETLFNGRQRFGNRSANMFFVRPARHIACPRRLKYIHDIKTGYIPYVEDCAYPNPSSYKNLLPKMHDDDMNKTNGLGLYNSVDAWRHELMELAQQVKSSLVPADEREQQLRQSRLSRLNKYPCKRSNSSSSSYNFEENDEQNVSKRLLYRRTNPRYQRSKITKSKSTNEKPEPEQTTINDENQDPGIWLIPILCYILQIDNIVEAQDWLINANPTEKRLAMELISRTMQDMQNNEIDPLSDNSTSDLSTITTTSATNLNNVYWPYKLFQRQEKDRQQQQQIQNFVKQSKIPSYPPLPSLTVDNGETCERATSPVRILIPAKRSPPTANNHFIPVETTIIERPLTRNTNDQTTLTVVIQQNQSPPTDRSSAVEKRPPSRFSTPIIMNGNDRQSRRSYRVTTSLNNSINEDTNSVTSTIRGKTPLI